MRFIPAYIAFQQWDKPGRRECEPDWRARCSPPLPSNHRAQDMLSW